MNQQIRQAKAKARHTKSIEVAGDIYGCHSNVAPNRLKAQFVWHSQGKTAWDNKFTPECEYQKLAKDDSKCDGCSRLIKDGE